MLNSPDNPLTYNKARAQREATCSLEVHYYGSPCRKCGGLVRNICNGTCVVCAKEQRASHRDSNRSEILAHAAAYQRNFDSEIISAAAMCCGAVLTATRGIHRALKRGAQKYCDHCRPDRLEALQPEAECYLYAAELDGRHGQITGFGIAADAGQRWTQHMRALRDESMHVVGAVWVSQRMTRAECLRIESRLKTIADGAPVPGFKTESFKSHCLQTVLDLIAELTQKGPGLCKHPGNLSPHRS